MRVYMYTSNHAVIGCRAENIAAKESERPAAHCSERSHARVQSNPEMNACSIPAPVKAMLRIEDALSSHVIDELLARYLRVRGFSSPDGLEHELARGAKCAAHVIAGFEALHHTSSPVVHSAHAQRETDKASIPHARGRGVEIIARRMLHSSMRTNTSMGS